MSDPNPLILNTQTGSRITVPFTWHTSEQGWVGDCDFAVNSTRAALAADCHWTDLQTFLQQALGYSYRDPVDPTKLKRVLPVRHPKFQWLLCDGVRSIQGLGFLGKEHQDSYDTPGTNVEFATYKRARCMLGFGCPAYNAIPDDVMATDNRSEWERFVVPGQRPAAKYMTPVGSKAFSWESVAPNGAQPLLSQPGYLEVNNDLTFKWLQVPSYPGVMDVNGKLANIMPLLGGVNDQPWNGYPAGTLLFEEPEIEWVTLPLPLSTIYSGVPTWLSPRAVNITFHFRYFDPPPAKDTSGNVIATGRGHNLARHQTDLQYYAFFGGTSHNVPLYRSVSFPQAWQLVPS